MNNSGHANPALRCPTDEQLTLWAQGLLSPDEAGRVLVHAQTCAMCRELIEVLNPAELSQQSPAGVVPEDISPSVRTIIKQLWETQIVRVLIRITDSIYSAAETTGRVIAAPWLAGEVALRSAGESHAQRVIIQADFRDIRCMVESSRVAPGMHMLKVSFNKTATGEAVDLGQVILYDDSGELESQPSVNGTAAFEDLPAGNYRMALSFAGGEQGYLEIYLVDSGP